MYLSKENVILEPSKKYVQVGNLIDELEYKAIDICALKTSLLPTIKLPKNSQILTPSAYEKNGKHYLRNTFSPVIDLTEQDFIYIPQLDSIETESVPRVIAWLYGKYIANGYIKNNGSIEQIIIPVKIMSSKEEHMVETLDSTVSINSKSGKVVICTNANIITLFRNFARAKSLKPFIIKAPESIYKLFLRSLLLEKDDVGRVRIENLVLVHELFIHTYSKTGKILKIIEERTGSKKRKKSASKKNYFLFMASEDDYKMIGGYLYTKIIQNRYGKNTLGVDCSLNQLFHEPELICNSIILNNEL